MEGLHVGLESFQLFCQKFQLLDFLGQGAFGIVWKANHLPTGKKIAIKFSEKNRLAIHEIKIYQLIKNRESFNLKPIPDLYGDGNICGFTWLAMDLLGPSIEATYEKLGSFSITTILMMGIRMIECLEYLHSCRIVHGDIKADNFAISANNSKKILIFDFGLAREFDSPIADFHGSLSYASIATHKYEPVHPKDDIESLGYLLADFHKSLPWTDGNWPEDAEEQIEYGLQRKQEKNIFEMTPNFFELTLFLMHVDAHKKPNTTFLKNMFR